MKHHTQVFISYILAMSMSMILLINQFPLIANATENIPEGKKAVAHQQNFSPLLWNYAFHSKYWTIQDPTGIPQEQNETFYFYTKDNVTFFAINGTKLITSIFNGKLGIVKSDNDIKALIQTFFSEIMLSKDTVLNTFVQGGLYDANNNFLGYCLNDISGCYYQGVNNNQNITVPSETVNNVYYFYNHYLEQNYDVPNFITVYPATYNQIRQKYKPYPSSVDVQAAQQFTNIQYLLSNYNYLTDLNLALFDTNNDNNNNYFDWLAFGNVSVGTVNWGSTKVWNTDCYFINNSTANNYLYWNNFCAAYDLNKDSNSLYFDTIWNNPNLDKTGIDYIVYNSSTNEQLTNADRGISVLVNLDDPNNANANTTLSTFHLGRGGFNNGKRVTQMLAGKPYTIYKNLQSYQGIKDKTYKPDTFYSTKYYNYNPQADNSFNTTTTIIQNSTTSNQTIYEDASDNYYDYVDNSVVDNDVINQYIEETTIIYYPENPTDPDDPTNPDNPSDPDNPLDPDNPSGILDAILDALSRFFKAIGKILATILAGLLEVVDSVLEAVASIAENFTGVTNFITALLSWMPEPVPQVLGAALSVAILFALLSFIRG